MPINRRTAIRDLLILAPASYVKLPLITFHKKPVLSGFDTLISERHSIYTYLLNPREYPDDERRFTKPPDWNTFNNETQFITFRQFQIQNNQIVHYKEDLNRYIQEYKLGTVIWPFHDFLQAENLSELLDEFERRKLFLFDIWGYVPGSGPGEWEQYQLAPSVSNLLISKLGNHWLGMDNGEQDGRYIGGYASQMYPQSAERVYQYFNFQRHFEQLTNDLGNRMATLVSLSYGHYFLKEGLYTLIGAETAQGLPNDQIYYSFIRGAGKQYGVPWFGNASVWNRWGHKTYDTTGVDYGPTKGTSLSLMRRLMYSHILYNAMAVGFEAGWLYSKKVASPSSIIKENALTPIGHIQQNAVKWVKEHGQPGVMYTPVALMLDFFAGWTFPRHLYSSDVYRVWGNLPYAPGDYLTDAILNMLYPGYQNSSYYHDETGFLCKTPFGDIADCILSDAESWLLERYPLLVIAGELSGGTEINDKLQKYIASGGHLVITAGNLLKFKNGLGGIKIKGEPKRFEKGQVVYLNKEKITEEIPFEIYPLALLENNGALAIADNMPAAVTTNYKQGKITVISSPYAISSDNVLSGKSEMQDEYDNPLTKPYPLLKHVQTILSNIFKSQMLFSINEELSLITCCKGNSDYTLGIANNSWEEQPFNIESYCGDIKDVKELELKQSGKTTIGYLPEMISEGQIGMSKENTIAGGDVRIFSVQTQEREIEYIPHQILPARPQGRFLPIRNIEQIKEEILRRPTFFTHFDGVVVDWKYLAHREKKILQEEAGWIGRQKLRMIVDLTSGVDLYPEIRLIDNLHSAYMNSMSIIEDVIDKMPVLGAKELIIPLHRFPENNFTKQQTWESFKKTFNTLCKYAEQYDVNLNLRITLGRPPYTMEEAFNFIGEVDAYNFKAAPETAFILAKDIQISPIINSYKNKMGLWLVSALEKDIDSKYWNQNLPVANFTKEKKLSEIINSDTNIPFVLDAIYKNQDEEYLDVCVLDKTLKS